MATDPTKHPIRAAMEKHKWLSGYAQLQIIDASDSRLAEVDAEIDEMERRLALWPEVVKDMAELIRQSEPLFQVMKAAYESAFGEPPPETAWDHARATVARAKGESA